MEDLKMETDDCICIEEEEDEAGDSLPPANECMKLCETFAEFTETDKALAMMYLQQTSWNLELALASFYDGTGDQAPTTTKRPEHANQPRPERLLPPNNVIATAVCAPVCTSDTQHAHLFRVLSWNIDGLSDKSCDFRTEAVIKIIQAEMFHVVCLQEVVRATLSMLERDLSVLYNIFYPSDVTRRDYFPVICVLKHPALCVDPASFRVVPFHGSVMQRVLLSLDLHFSPTQLLPTNRKASTASASIRVRLWTSHLESCANFADERMCQLKQSWKEMTDSLLTGNSASLEPFYGIFCGDLNIRDKEITHLGGLPAGIVDVWQSAGGRREAKITWDPRRNPNLSLDHPNSGSGSTYRAQYGMRFDRMYAAGSGLSPIDFELRGLERVPGRTHFPSDHWAILGHFDLV
uniref:Tyrosyl-DNA phosphodiesterase 2 n=2 Tax=Schistocephalus solidus TaxID=70667 RepID=A0A0X3PLD9_SCHSO